MGEMQWGSSRTFDSHSSGGDHSPCRPAATSIRFSTFDRSRPAANPASTWGDRWVHLRMCMTDGAVLCCESSKNKHASRHAGEHAPTHQVARSVEPGEDWLWCYTDQVLVKAPGGDGTT